MLSNIINKMGWAVLLCSGLCLMILPPSMLVTMGLIGSGMVLVGSLSQRASYSSYSRSKKGNNSFLGNRGGCGGCCGGCGGGDGC